MLAQWQINELRKRYAGIASVDPCGKAYPELVRLLDMLSQADLQGLVDADIKWVSSLARNRIKH